MRIVAAACAGNFDGQAVPVPSGFLRCANESLAHPAPAGRAIDDEALDPSPPPGSLEVRDRVHGEAADDLLVMFGYEDPAQPVTPPVLKPPGDLVNCDRVTELGEECGDKFGVASLDLPDGRVT
jgi:hypothetical protein